MSRNAAPSGCTIDVEVNRIEPIPMPKSKSGGRRWPLHTSQGLYLTEPNSPVNSVLKGAGPGPMTPMLSDNKVIKIVAHGA